MKINCSYTDMIDIDLLVPNPKNPNKHPEEQIKYLAKIMNHQGWRHPIIVSNLSGFVVSGHGRLMAAKKNGWTKAPVDKQDFASEADEYAHLIADNKIAELAEHDDQMMIEDLKLFPDLDLELLGIPDFEMPEILEPGCDEDSVPDFEKNTWVKRGDLFQLGDHRLLCGDSTNIVDVEKLMGGEIADITFASPPYNLGNNAKLRGYNGDSDDSVYIEKSDHKSQDEYLSFLSAWTLLAMKFSTNVFCNIQLLAGNKLAIPKYWMAFHNNLIDLMIWDKEHAQPSAAPHVLNSVFEMIFIFTQEENPKRSIRTGREFRGTIDNIFRLNPIRGGKDEFQKYHGAVFPIAFAEHFITNFSKNSVIDLFGGTGSTLIACEKTNRKCFMMELDEHYCSVIIERWEKFSNKKAFMIKPDGSKISWEEVKNGVAQIN